MHVKEGLLVYFYFFLSGAWNKWIQDEQNEFQRVREFLMRKPIIFNKSLCLCGSLTEILLFFCENRKKRFFSSLLHEMQLDKLSHYVSSSFILILSSALPFCFKCVFCHFLFSL